MSYRACEVCGKNDLETHVFTSTIGAMSYNYCKCCLSMSSEPSGLENLVGTYITYDKLSDSYRYGLVIVPIKLKSGSEFKTRTEFVNYVIENNLK